ncbi:MAG: hypothetical protein ACOZIN_19515 [Myxococcota bacterium]
MKWAAGQRALFALLAAGLCLPAAADEPSWEVVATGAITVKSRARPGSNIKEIWAEGEINAPVADIQAALMNPDRFPTFMPYVKEAREVGRPEADGSRYVYTRLDLPLVAPRDYVLKVKLVEGVDGEGKGTFRNHWVAASNYLPKRANIVRLQVNEGSWVVRPVGDGAKSWAVYKFTVDPGGWIPAFAADMGNKSGVTDTFKAVEKEASRRCQERKANGAR